jgi:hypothetical protein
VLVRADATPRQSICLCTYILTHQAAQAMGDENDRSVGLSEVSIAFVLCKSRPGSEPVVGLIQNRLLPCESQGQTADSWHGCELRCLRPGTLGQQGSNRSRKLRSWRWAIRKAAVPRAMVLLVSMPTLRAHSRCPRDRPSVHAKTLCWQPVVSMSTSVVYWSTEIQETVGETHSTDGFLGSYHVLIPYSPFLTGEHESLEPFDGGECHFMVGFHRPPTSRKGRQLSQTRA